MAEGRVKGKCPKCAKGVLDKGPIYKASAIKECLVYYCTVCNYSIQVPCKDAEELK